MVKDWYTEFADYIESIQSRRFQYGVHDCLTLTDAAVRMQRGFGLTEGIAWVYKPGVLLERSELRRRNKYSTLHAFLDDRLKRTDDKYPPRGSIAAIKNRFALGVVFGHGIVTIAPIGTDFVELNRAAAFWTVQ